eukprot:TRINITY_DN2271_c0_g1_i1.p1 TRINITY_DN2271_c0_g1~~TRINITY_DN2271_c0_g1_i1.p1  ORF type:complete len:421 (-),score=124.36 TRINITY_DN2271_c0_g1_i1:221-1483(-)
MAAPPKTLQKAYSSSNVSNTMLAPAKPQLSRSASSNTEIKDPYAQTKTMPNKAAGGGGPSGASAKKPALQRSPSQPNVKANISKDGPIDGSQIEGAETSFSVSYKPFHATPAPVGGNTRPVLTRSPSQPESGIKKIMKEVSGDGKADSPRTTPNTPPPTPANTPTLSPFVVPIMGARRPVNQLSLLTDSPTKGSRRFASRIVGDEMEQLQSMWEGEGAEGAEGESQEVQEEQAEEPKKLNYQEIDHTSSYPIPSQKKQQQIINTPPDEDRNYSGIHKFQSPVQPLPSNIVAEEKCSAAIVGTEERMEMFEGESQTTAKKFIAFVVLVVAGEKKWMIYRRFNQFHLLKKQIKKKFGFKPPFPKKGGMNDYVAKLEDDVVTYRANGLNEFLKFVLADKKLYNFDRTQSFLAPMQLGDKKRVD